MRQTDGQTPVRNVFHFTHSSFLFFVVAFNLGASSCVAGPSKTRYSNIISHNLSGIVGLSWFNT